MHFRFALALLVAMPGPALADDAACQRDGSMPEEFLKVMDGLDGIVTLVPPDESKYIGEEYAAAYKAQSEARMQVLVARPMYYPHMFHVEVETARIQLKVLTITTLAPRERVRMAAFMPAHVMMMKSAFEDVIAHDHRGTVSKVDRDWAIGRLDLELNDIQQYISCWVDKI